MTKLTGGCLCGAVRYQVGAPTATVACHCVNCIVPADSVELTGQVTTYLDRGDSGNGVRRLFCGACGSPILSELEASPNIVALKAGTLDEPARVEPTIEVFCDSAVPWARLASCRTSFGRAPPPRPAARP